MIVDFRIVEIKDIDRVLPLMREFYAAERLPFDEAIARAGLQTLVCEKALGGAWLIQCDGEVVGYMVMAWGFSLEFYGRYAWLDEFYIHAPHRGHGIGRQALGFLDEWCRSCGVRAIRLEVGETNIHAQRLYARSGFGFHNRELMTRWIEPSMQE